MSFDDFDINYLNLTDTADVDIKNINLEELKEQLKDTPAEPEIPAEKKRKGSKKSSDDSGMELYDWLQCIVSALVCGILIFMFFARIISVDGSSMYPTLHHADKMITSNLFYTPKSGDVIVLRTNTFRDEPIVKRVIATEGQTVNIDFIEGVVYVDGEALDEPYTASPTYEPEDFTGEVTVPEGCIFVMGDNRNASTDSRSSLIGMVDERCVIGKVLFIVFPGEDEFNARDFKRIGSVYK